MANRFFDSNGVEIEFVVQGQGEPLVLIHGLLSDIEGGWVLPGTLQTLATEYQVIALNCRAHGKSGSPVDITAYGQEMLKDVIRLLDHLNIPKAHLLGWSMGAGLAVNLALRFSERVTSAVLLAPTPLVPYGSATQVRLQDAMNQSANYAEFGTDSFSLIEYLAPLDAPGLSPEEAETVAQNLLADRNRNALSALLRAWEQLAMEDDLLAGNCIPILAILGTRDPSTSHIAALAESLPHLTVVTIEGAAHWFQGYYEEWLSHATAFLREH